MRLTEGEKRRAKGMAETVGVSLSVFCRSRLLARLTDADSGMRDPSPSERRSKQRDEAIRQLSGLGNNLNQLMRRINATDDDYKFRDDLEALLPDIRTEIRRLGALWSSGQSE